MRVINAPPHAAPPLSQLSRPSSPLPINVAEKINKYLLAINIDTIIKWVILITIPNPAKPRGSYQDTALHPSQQVQSAQSLQPVPVC